MLHQILYFFFLCSLLTISNFLTLSPKKTDTHITRSQFSENFHISQLLNSSSPQLVCFHHSNSITYAHKLTKLITFTLKINCSHKNNSHSQKKFDFNFHLLSVLKLDLSIEKHLILFHCFSNYFRSRSAKFLDKFSNIHQLVKNARRQLFSSTFNSSATCNGFLLNITAS